ncbi:hypothetical protein BDW02DRAFT_484291, partial [Decorospora gaudefroyi]
LLLPSTAAAPKPALGCQREFLVQFTSVYLRAQTLGNSSQIFETLVSSNFTYTEQFQPANISAPSSILNTPLNVTNNRVFIDVERCTAFTEIIAPQGPHPYVIGVRVEGTEDGKHVRKIETLVSDAGDWAFNATGTAYWNSKEDWSPIPAEEQDSREVIQAAGDAYFDRFGNVNVTVPFGTPCARLEGGAYTDPRMTNASTCALGLPSNIHVVNRRYVVDPRMGTVNMYLGFPGLDRASDEPAPDSHTFRVEKGKIRYIHTISTCEGHPGCGLNGTVVP